MKTTDALKAAGFVLHQVGGGAEQWRVVCRGHFGLVYWEREGGQTGDMDAHAAISCGTGTSHEVAESY